jgi:two-component system, NtrC family, sensor kinase
MRRRSRASSKVAKARSRKATPKRRSPTTVRAESESARLRRERDEALLREAANSEILSLISRSPGDLEPVFQAILENATRICDAKFGVLDLAEGDCFRRTAHYNTPPAFLELLSREPVFRPGPRTALARVAATKQPVHIADIASRTTLCGTRPFAQSSVF